MQNPHSSTNSNANINPSIPTPNQDPAIQHQPRRPRGFAATATATTVEASPNAPASAKGKREREKEKERTKLRERHRRAITRRMLAGLRQYGNFPLPASADMNDVLSALAREAGWTVEPDGTTYRHSPPPQQMVCFLSSLFFDYFIVGMAKRGRVSLIYCAAKYVIIAALCLIMRSDPYPS
ncbi:hypothetical protein SLEP1_g21382 [Rubroshorea leprosula]|uniref:Protein BZR1 homolog n=1 Tax=Rubroshorea leprosula TaxID=152421 RepID=A0AAV5JEI6_9ROSI|nr:hypothetical protein SLEP1_g21382 [Rubroshorea leprosula]